MRREQALLLSTVLVLLFSITVGSCYMALEEGTASAAMKVEMKGLPSGYEGDFIRVWVYPESGIEGIGVNYTDQGAEYEIYAAEDALIPIGGDKPYEDFPADPNGGSFLIEGIVPSTRIVLLLGLYNKDGTIANYTGQSEPFAIDPFGSYETLPISLTYTS